VKVLFAEMVDLGAIVGVRQRTRSLEHYALDYVMIRELEFLTSIRHRKKAAPVDSALAVNVYVPALRVL